MISIQYLMARDGELPASLARINRYGVPWQPAVIASVVPIIVLVISHNLDQLAALYAIGVIGAVAINICLCPFHPRLRKLRRKIPMALLGVILLFIWVTLAYVKQQALIFVTIVMVVGLGARQLHKWLGRRKGPQVSLLRQAIQYQLANDSPDRPRILVGTYGSVGLAIPALREAKRTGATLVVCFIRTIRIAYSWDKILNMDTDVAALRVFARFLDLAHDMKVPVLPVYDTGEDAVELMAETAAITGCTRILIGTSRQGALYHLIKGHFQQRLEALLPEEITVQVLPPERLPEDFFPGDSPVAFTASPASGDRRGGGSSTN
jgi:amino acid transporter